MNATPPAAPFPSFLDCVRAHFVALPAAFRGKQGYVEVMRGRGLAGWIWLAFLCGLAAVVVTARFHGELIAKSDERLDAALAQVPTLHFKDGKLRSEPRGEHLVVIGEELVAVIDDSVEGVAQDLQGAYFFLGRDFAVSLQKRSGQLRAHPYDWIGEKSVTRDDWRRWWSNWLVWGWLPLGLLIWCWFVAGWAMLAALVALAGLGLRSLFGAEQGFGVLWRTTTFALGPVIAIDLVNDLLGAPLAFGFWLRLAVGLGLLVFAIRCEQDAAPDEPVEA